MGFSMKNYILENEEIKVTISLDGGQVYSFKEKTKDKEYCYDGNPLYWKGRNPILFPQIGTYDPLIFKGKIYKQPNHGILRNAQFNFNYQNEDSLSLKYFSNQESYLLYPYNFEFEIIYKIKNKKLEINYEITNLDEADMPFCFGLHPAFKINSLNDITIFFEKEEDDILYHKIKNKKLILNDEDFNKVPTFIYENLKSNYVVLNDEIKISFEGFNYLAFWKKMEACFICIEPWLQRPSLKMEDELLKDKEVIKLKPKEKYCISYFWQIL